MKSRERSDNQLNQHPAALEAGCCYPGEPAKQRAWARGDQVSFRSSATQREHWNASKALDREVSYHLGPVFAAADIFWLEFFILVEL